MKVKNETQAPQGVRFNGEIVWIKPGDSYEADMTDAEAKLVALNDGLKTTGKPVPDKAG